MCPADYVDGTVWPVLECPKRMVVGPCGGVRVDGGCEVRAGACTFPEVVAWPGEPVAPVAPLDVPRVLVDFTSRPYSRVTFEEVAAILSTEVDAVLVGEHQDHPDFPPVLAATMLRAAGLAPWITLTCRDRNRVVLEQEIVGLREVGVAGVLCVTGDARGPDVLPEVTQVFDLDGPRLAALVSSLGVPAACPETPTAPPVGQRGYRLVQKQNAGASVAVLNHAAVGSVAATVASAQARGLTIPVIAGVAVYTDSRSAGALAGLPGFELDPAEVGAVLSAADPVEAGIAAAVDEAARLLAVPGVAGVNLSGLASARGYRHGAEVKAEIARRVQAWS